MDVFLTLLGSIVGAVGRQTVAKITSKICAKNDVEKMVPRKPEHSKGVPSQDPGGRPGIPKSAELGSKRGVKRGGKPPPWGLVGH